MKLTNLLILFLFATFQSFSQERVFFENPVIRGDMADPTVVRVGKTYYATGTSSEWAPFYPVFTSDDLVNWEQVGHIFDEKPEWTSHSFWAPELFYHNNTMFCYYTARRKTDNVSFIGVASAEGTSLRFIDHGPVVELGTEAIDAFVYDDNGQLYLTWKAYGLDRRPIELLGSRLSADGLRLEGEPFSLLKDDEGIGMEGQYHFKQGDYYYTIYSSKGCCGPSSDYDVRVARSKNFMGPYEIYADNPILSGGEGDYMSCGHGTVTETPDGRFFYLSHGYQSGDAFFLGRQPILHELEMTDDGWIRFTTGEKAVNRVPAPFEGIVQQKSMGFEDDFSGETLKVEWTWNYPFADVKATLKDGRLVLSGIPVDGKEPGAALCLRPQTTRYSYQAKIGNVNDSFKGLTMYGDDKNWVAIGIKGNRVIVKSVKNGEESVLFDTVSGRTQSAENGEQIGAGHSQTLTNEATPHFKIDVERGRFLTFAYSVAGESCCGEGVSHNEGVKTCNENGKSWIIVNETPLDATFLVRWDRIARPGLIQIGESDAPAEFDYFTLKNNKD